MAMCYIKREKLFTQNVTNVTFSFETSPNKTLREKCGGDMALCPPRLKKWGTRLPCPPPNCAHGRRQNGGAK